MNIVDGVSKIWERGKDAWGNYQSYDDNCESIQTLVTDFLEKAKEKGEILDFASDSVSFDCGPASEPGAYFFSWIEKNGKLEVMTYEWEN